MHAASGNKASIYNKEVIMFKRPSSCLSNMAAAEAFPVKFKSQWRNGISIRTRTRLKIVDGGMVGAGVAGVAAECEDKDEVTTIIEELVVYDKIGDAAERGAELSTIEVMLNILRDHDNDHETETETDLRRISRTGSRTERTTRKPAKSIKGTKSRKSRKPNGLLHHPHHRARVRKLSG
jgi:hypothetical protein